MTMSLSSSSSSSTDNIDVYPFKSRLVCAGRFKITQTILVDSCWQIVDLLDNKKRKLLRAVILDNYVKLLRVLNKMEHSNLWKYVLFKETDRYFVIQDSDYDLIEDSLAIRLETYKKNDIELDEAKIVDWFYQILSAVSYLHNNKIVHCKLDINVKIINEKLMINVDSSSSLVNSLDDRIKVSKKQLPYNCPELIGDHSIDYKYDVWSLGWILYQMCTLEAPKLGDVVDFINWSKPNLGVNLSDEIRTLYRQMTRIEPKSRPNLTELLNYPIFSEKKNDLKLGAVLKRRYKIKEIVKESLRFNVLDLKDNEIKQLIVIEEDQNMKINFCTREFLNGYVTECRYFMENTALCLVRPYFEITLYNKLDEIKEKGHSLREGLILNWLRSLSSAVRYLHEMNVLHRWINPREIGFVNGTQLKLNLTTQSVLLNSKRELIRIESKDVFYVAPECFRTKLINLKYDIWSLGCTLYQICTLDNNLVIDLEKMKNLSEFSDYFNLSNLYSLDLRLLFRKMIDLNPDLRPDIATIQSNKIFNSF